MKYLVMLTILVSLGHLTLSHANSIDSQDGIFQGQSHFVANLDQDENAPSINEQMEQKRSEACSIACGKCDPNHEGGCVITRQWDTVGLSGYYEADADFNCTALKRFAGSDDSSALIACH